MQYSRVKLAKPRKGVRAVSPALSTVMLTGAIVVMLLVVVTFANSYLNAQIAQNEFAAMEQFMQTIGLQTDYVAWISGQTQTTRFASRFGFLSFYPVYLNYSVYLDDSPSSTFSYLTRVLLFNMPISSYNIANGHYEQIIPTSSSSFLQTGTSAVVARVFVIEKLPMTDGSYVRIVVAPCIRAMNSTVPTGESTPPAHYTKLYLPLLVAGSQQGNFQSVTLAGTDVIRDSQGNVSSVVVRVSFPNQTLGFGSDFFRFSSLNETVGVFLRSTIEFYTGEVTVSLGLYG
jgi:hypothetical protein